MKICKVEYAYFVLWKEEGMFCTVEGRRYVHTEDSDRQGVY